MSMLRSISAKTSCLVPVTDTVCQLNSFDGARPRGAGAERGERWHLARSNTHAAATAAHGTGQGKHVL